MRWPLVFTRPRKGALFFFGWGRGMGASRPGMCLRHCARRTGFLISSSPNQKKEKGPARGPFLFLAGGEGFEPPLAESESAVLPLDDPPKRIV